MPTLKGGNIMQYKNVSFLDLLDKLAQKIYGQNIDKIEDEDMWQYLLSIAEKEANKDVDIKE